MNFRLPKRIERRRLGKSDIPGIIYSDHPWFAAREPFLFSVTRQQLILILMRGVLTCSSTAKVT
jgi:hypothetical protein